MNFGEEYVRHVIEKNVQLRNAPVRCQDDYQQLEVVPMVFLLKSTRHWKEGNPSHRHRIH